MTVLRGSFGNRSRFHGRTSPLVGEVNGSRPNPTISVSRSLSASLLLHAGPSQNPEVGLSHGIRNCQATMSASNLTFQRLHVPTKVSKPQLPETIIEMFRSLPPAGH